MSKTNATALTARQVWDLLHPLIRGLDLTPTAIKQRLGHVDIQLEENDTEGVAALMSALCLGEPAWYMSRDTGVVYRWFEGEDDEFTAYGNYNTGYQQKTPAVQGWSVEVYAHVRTRTATEDPSVIAPVPAELDAALTDSRAALRAEGDGWCGWTGEQACVNGSNGDDHLCVGHRELFNATVGRVLGDQS